MGDFAHLLHIRPWELSLLTIDEFKNLIDTINATRSAIAESGE